jgi:anti-anti-sigma regulatory factor
MLRISVLNGSGTRRLKLEGKLAHEWVHEAEKAWSALTLLTGCSDLVVDLLDVSFVDDSGHELLAAMRHAGAELVASGPMMSALIEEIEKNEEKETASAHEVTNRDWPEIDKDSEELKQ